MFKNIAADVLGLSDIGKIIDRKDFDKTDVDDYIFQEDDEKIFVVIKSKTDEYCFTNLALIHLDGNLAISKKKTLYRYLYKYHTISNVRIETAGTVDLDAELKFKMGEKDFSIDIDKNQIEKIKDVYKALFMISEKCKEIRRFSEALQSTHEAFLKMFLLRQVSDQIVLNLPDIIDQSVQQIKNNYEAQRKEIQNYDFAPIFQRYIKW